MILFILAGYLCFLLVFYAAMITANVVFYRGVSTRSTSPFTVIKPLKGAEEGLEENLRGLLEADGEGRLQVLFAVESEDDAAHAIARKVLAAFPGRDAAIVVTGASGERMGKIHNMIEALPKARHGRIVFSDSDVFADARLLGETSAAFDRGAQAVYAAPYFHRVTGFAQGLFALAFNYGFSVGGALMAKAGVFRGFSGAWMGFTRQALDRVGGLEPFSTVVADDYALGMAMLKAGVPVGLLRAPAELRETASDVWAALAHFYKWGVVVRGAVPEVFFGVLVHGTLMTTFAVAATVAAFQGVWWPVQLCAAGTVVRMLGAAIQDIGIIGRPLPAWLYLLLPFQDCGQLPFWLATCSTDTFSWRGKVYRLKSGRRLEVLPSTQSGR